MMQTDPKTHERIVVTQRDRIGELRLNRPESLNALDDLTRRELLTEAARLDADPNTGAIVIAGGERAFAAGVDVREMANARTEDLYRGDAFGDWQKIAGLRTPVIAAVRGYALGGGCELAMMADIVIAGTSARFGQPEISLGVIPGMGGTQRLVRAVGKSVAMDIVLSGRMITATEALAFGLVARVVPDEDVLSTAHSVAEKVASMPPTAAALAKEAVLAAYEVPLSSGLVWERRVFHSLFATPEQREGMSAFMEKRAPNFR
jgi:enoyl-CoA hydratase